MLQQIRGSKGVIVVPNPYRGDVDSDYEFVGKFVIIK